MSPAQFQANVWMGAGTGVADDRPFMDVFNMVLERTAKKHGVSKEKALKDFINAESPLWNLMPYGVGLGLLGTQLDSEQQIY